MANQTFISPRLESSSVSMVASGTAANRANGAPILGRAIGTGSLPATREEIERFAPFSRDKGIK
jgi:hypothetical protein